MNKVHKNWEPQDRRLVFVGQKIICLSVSAPEDLYFGLLEIEDSKELSEKYISFKIDLEDGRSLTVPKNVRVEGANATSIVLGAIPVGYHELVGIDVNHRVTRWYLFVHPLQCFLPEVEHAERALNVQLYAIRNDKNWGIGSYTDLGELMKMAEGRYRYIGINPLHALSPALPESASPYAPDSRMLFNEIYIDVEAAASKFGNIEITDRIKAIGRSPQVRRLRHEDQVHYREVYAIKLRCLEMLFQKIVELEKSFQQMTHSLNAFLASADPIVISAIVRRARQRNWNSFADLEEQCVFEFFLQWLCTVQLEDAQKESSCGIYTDLAIGCKTGGTDNAITGNLFEVERSLGAPPDAFCTEGQKWNVAPLSLRVLRDTGYRYFRAILKNNMMQGGALRIDHIIGLARRFTMDINDSAASGWTEEMPFREFLAIIAIESHRKQCIVIGEDLGAVPRGLRSTMNEYNVLGCYIWLLEEGPLKYAPETECRDKVLFSFGTHDCIPMAGYFSGRDIAINAALKRGDSDAGKRALASRYSLYKSMFVDQCLDIKSTADRVAALEQLSQKRSARINAFSLDDILGEHDPVNLPGTDSEYPNWRRRYSRPIESDDFRVDENIK